MFPDHSVCPLLIKSGEDFSLLQRSRTWRGKNIFLVFEFQNPGPVGVGKDWPH